MVLRVGIPASITNVLGPVATAMLTAIVATHGSAAVAAYGIGARVESLVLIAPVALSSGLSPFIGQNWGAHLEARVAKGFQLALNFSILWGLGAFLVLLAAAPQIAAVFSEEKAAEVNCIFVSPLVLKLMLMVTHRLMPWIMHFVLRFSGCCDRLFCGSTYGLAVTALEGVFFGLAWVHFSRC